MTHDSWALSAMRSKESGGGCAKDHKDWTGMVWIKVIFSAEAFPGEVSREHVRVLPTNTHLLIS